MTAPLDQVSSQPPVDTSDAEFEAIANVGKAEMDRDPTNAIFSNDLLAFIQSRRG